MTLLDTYKGHNPYFSGNFFATNKNNNFIDGLTVTILILVETSLQHQESQSSYFIDQVTILILVETSLQLREEAYNEATKNSHNPYFSGNFFATKFILLSMVYIY